MNKIFILLLSCIVFSCDSNTPENGYDCCTVVDLDIDFSFTNEKGEDLLNPETDGYYSLDSIQLYYLINNEKVKVQDYDLQMGGNNGLLLITEMNPYALRCFTSGSAFEEIRNSEEKELNGQSINYLELNSETTDTIRTEWEYGEGYFVVTKVWFNDMECEIDGYNFISK